ncbi:hypothetical protein B0H10DRAFT_2169642 [Mycena sp. CBHHK59/15]|nr:hypothetical protein B0H10DRAFT_2169642 [Mycena sp. CBHHK59/15]
MLALGLQDLPSDRVMDDIDKYLQKMCGVQSIRYSGKLGHVYYVNDLAALIAQEMANPTVRENICFLPEDTKPSLSQAWQAKCCIFFINEPTLLSNGIVCIPVRWFTRGKKTFARGNLTSWTKTNAADGNQWCKLSAGHRVLAFPIWLYCNDTSGNTSKKWNKHNSFLFTVAGLP